MRGVIAELQQAHVCWRRAMRNDGRGIFLIVVWWEPVVISAAKSFEEAPRGPSDQPRKRPVFWVQSLSLWRSRLAHEMSNQRRENPDDEERFHHQKRARLEAEREANRNDRQYQRRQHELNERL